MERKDVYNFAVKWNEKFRDPDIDYMELVDHYLADDCSALGFEMDCGHAFEEKFERAIYDARALDTIIENVNDISLLDRLYIPDGDISIIGHTMQQRYFLCPTGAGSLLLLIDWLNYVKMNKKTKRIRILPCSMNMATSRF